MSEPQAPATATIAPHAIIPEKKPAPRVKDDRRKEPRYPAKHDRANIGWYCGESYQTLPGRLEDVSSGGASLVLDGTTWQGGDVWLCLTGGVRTEWVRAEVVGASLVEGDAQHVRLKFHESCPFDFFKTAAWGNPSSGSAPREPFPTGRTDSKPAGQGPHVACPPADAIVEDFGELRVSVTLYQSTPVLEEPRVGRLRDDEQDDRVELLPKAYLAVVQLVGALLLGAFVIVKLVEFWRLDALLGFGESRL